MAGSEHVSRVQERGSMKGRSRRRGKGKGNEGKKRKERKLKRITAQLEKSIEHESADPSHRKIFGGAGTAAVTGSVRPAPRTGLRRAPWCKPRGGQDAQRAEHTNTKTGDAGTHRGSRWKYKKCIGEGAY